MTIRNYTRGDAAEVLRLWNTAGAQTMGYAPQSAEGLDALLLRHPKRAPCRRAADDPP